MNTKKPLLSALAVIGGVFILIFSLPDRNAPDVASPLFPAEHAQGADQTAAPNRFTLRGIISETAGHAGAALIADGSAPPQLISEGGAIRPGVRLERVLPDRVLLRLEGVTAPLELTLSVAANGTPDLLAPPPLPQSLVSSGESELPDPPRGSAPSVQPQVLPRDRVAAPIDASGPPPGAGLTGPALSGPTTN